MSETIFSKIIRKEIPAKIVFENERVLVFHDVHPQAPQHLLAIPKKEIADLRAANDEDAALLGELLLVANRVAKELGFFENGYRTVINNGAAVGQSVFHLHVHILAGREFSWPPG